MGEFWVNEGLVYPVRHRPMNDKFYEDYKAGQLDPIAYNEFVFEFLTQHDNAYLTELHELFMTKVIRLQMRPEGFAAIQQHHNAGHELVGITATSEFITAPIFREFGISEIMPPMQKWSMVNIPVKSLILHVIEKGKLMRLDQWLAGRDVS